MKLLFLASWYPTESNPNFGIFIKEHAKAVFLTKNQLVVLVLVVHRANVFYKKRINDSFDENGIRTIRIEVYTRFRDIVYHFIPLQYHLVKKHYNKKLSSNFVPDIIHSNVIFPAGIIGDKLARKLGKQHIITEHWSGLEKFSTTPLLSKMGYKSYKNAVKILPVSNFLQQNIRRIFPEISAEKFQIIPNVVDEKCFFYEEKVYSPEQLRLCIIANWNTAKHQTKLPELLIESIAEQQKKSPPQKKIHLCIVGDGNKLESLKQVCKEKNIHAEFTGFLSKSAVAEKLRRSDFLVHASTVETFGLVVIESLLCGTPVVCSNVGALPELVNDSNGILCENTKEAWVEALEKAMTSKFNHAEIAAAYRNKFSPETIAKTFDKLYRELAAEQDIRQ